MTAQNNFKIIQLNIQGLYNNLDELKHTLISDRIDVLCLQETWLEDHNADRIRMPQYNHFYQNREDGYGGSSIFVHKKYRTECVQIHQKNDHVQSIGVKLKYLNVTVISTYVKPTTPKNTYVKYLKLILQAADNTKAIITGDFNAHHKAWGNHYCDTRGKITLEEINSCDMIMVHNKEHSFINPDVRKKNTAIDLTIVSQSIVLDVERKVTNQHIGNSGHCIIHVTIKKPAKEYLRTVINRIRIEKQICDIKCTDNTSIDSINRSIKNITKQNTKTIAHSPKSWWNVELQNAWEIKNESRRIFNRNRSLENSIQFKKDLAKFKWLKKREKRKNFETWLDKVNSDSTSKELWDLVNKCHGKPKTHNGVNIIADNTNNAKEFLKLNFSSPKRATYQHSPNFITDTEILNLEKWRKILSSKKNTSPGIDGISYYALKLLNDEVSLAIIKEVNLMYQEGRVPKKLKRIKIVAIPKIGKDPNCVANYRPIALLSTLIKITNTAVLQKITEHVERYNLLPETSFGFRRRRSTLTLVNLLVHKILHNNSKKKYTGVVFIDVKNAYNSVLTKELLNILRRNMISGEDIAWIASFLSNRSLEITVGNTTIKRTVSNGLPQGDVMSPTLFNIYTSTCHGLNDRKIRILQYADDFAVIESGPTPKAVESALQRSVIWLKEQLEQLNLEINSAKSKLMTFPNNKFHIIVRVGGAAIEQTKEHKFLGITMDSNLRFNTHLEDQIAKTINRLNPIKTICNGRNHVNPEKAMEVHRAIVRGTVEYGIGFSLNANKGKLRKVDTLLNQSLRRITGCTRTTPLNTLHALAAERPFNIRSKYLVCKQLAKEIAYSAPNNALFSKLDQRRSTKLSAMEKSYLDNKVTFQSIATCKFNDSITSSRNIIIRASMPGLNNSKQQYNPNIARQISLVTINSTTPTALKVFTDGSKIEEKCGIGIYIIRGNQELLKKSYRLKNPVSICATELYAIKLALDFVVQEREVAPTIYTDSRAACLIIKGAAEELYTDLIVSEILQNGAKVNLSIQWIPSHVGIEGNETADSLAKEGTNCSEVIDNKIQLKDALTIFLNKAKQDTNTWYSDLCQHKGKTFAEYQTRMEKHMWHHRLRIPASDIKILNRLIAGHDHSNYWLHKMRLVDNGTCEACGEPDTAKHKVFHCLKYALERGRNTHINEEVFKKSWKMRKVSGLTKVVKFIKENRIRF